MGNPPLIDGIINESTWDLVDWGGDFIQFEPYENREPAQETMFKILFDDDFLYVAIRALDTSPDSIVQRLSRRDNFDGDWVEINIDSYHDLMTAFSFTINAAGVKGDEMITSNGNNWDPSWDPLWEGKTSIDAEGWSAEMKIPFTQIRFTNKNEYIWGIQFTRRLYRKEERSVWQRIPKDAGGWVHLFGELHGIKGIKPKKQKDITPYIVSGIERYEKELGNPFKKSGKDSRLSGGFDSKIGITNNLTLDITINPDFGQVEADPSEVNLTTFETFFEEKRPFFIEGRNIMDYRLTLGGSPMSRDNLFYSRRIGKNPGYWPDIEDNEYIDFPVNTTILGAMKLTGKTSNGINVGILESITSNEFAEISNGTHNKNINVEPLTNYFLARAQKELNEGNTQFGGMITSVNRFINTTELQNFYTTNAYTAGLDLNHQWKNKTYYFRFNAATSYVTGSKESILGQQESSRHYYQRPDAEHISIDSNQTILKGTGGYFQYGKSGNGNIRYLLWLTWRSPGFETNDMGYMRSADEILEVAWVQYRILNPISIFRNLVIDLNQFMGYDFGGTQLYRGFDIGYFLELKNFWNISNGYTFVSESMNKSIMRGGPYFIDPPVLYSFYNISTNPKNKLSFGIRGNHSWGSNNWQTNSNYRFNITYRPNNALVLSLTPGLGKSDNKIAYVENVDYNNETKYVRAAINRNDVDVTVRINYTITPDITIQIYGQPFVSAGNYSDYKLITDPKAGKFENRFISLEKNQYSHNTIDNIFNVDENLDELPDYSFEDPNYNQYYFNFNLVGRWEYKPGSVLYLVWSQNRSDSNNNGRFSLNDDFSELFGLYPHNILLLKLSYRIGL